MQLYDKIDFLYCTYILILYHLRAIFIFLHADVYTS